MSRRLQLTVLAAAVLATAGLTSATAVAATKAQVANANRQVRAEARSEGRTPAQPSASALRHVATPAAGASATTMTAPTTAQVGDADTFGRNVVYAGLISSGTITLAPDCTPIPGDPPPGPDDRCVTMNAAPALTTFDLPDVGRMWLPGKSSHNILCHWLSPIVTYSLFNGTGAPGNSRISLSPYLRIESEVLDDPSMIDPNTGLPFGGALETGFSATYQSAKTLAPGERDTEHFSESRVCIAGTISRQNLIDGYGLTDAQVNKFFKKPMTLKFGLRGSASFVDFASMIYGLRIMGD